MTVDSILTVALDGAFFAVFGLTLVDSVRHRGPVPEAKARLNGNVQGVLARGDDAIAAMHAWLAPSGSAA